MINKEERLHSLNNQTKRLQYRINQLQRTSYRWSWARVATFLATLLASSMALFMVGAWLFWSVLLGLGTAFTLVVVIHRRIEQSLSRHQILRTIHLAQIARMRLDWMQIPPTTIVQAEYEHPFEADLDLVGEYSLHRLIDTTVTDEGSQLLRECLTISVPEYASILQRQEIVRELAPLSLFRTKLLLNGTVATDRSQNEPLSALHQKWRASQIYDWFQSYESTNSLRIWLPILGGLAVANISLFALAWLGVLPTLWPITLGIYAILMFYTSVFGSNSTASKDIFQEAMEIQTDLERVMAVFHQLEKFSYRDTPHLQRLCHPFLDAIERPSAYLSRLKWIVAATGARGNPLVWVLLNGLMPWDLYFAYRLNQYKADAADHAPLWFKSWFELEALSALANLAYINPHYTFPEIRQGDESQSQNTDRRPVFHVESLGHPLLPNTEGQVKVHNDFTVHQLGEVAIITGSNMAGKSSFLKALGMNLVLAYAGGPVDAASLETELFRLFTCIKVSDSVTTGISYFYAEVRRLKALLSNLESTNGPPLFFCIDEIFRGTNNRERLIGSRAYIHSLAGKPGVGFVSTHDLELIKLANETNPITNYHFRDDLVQGQMVFDYTLRTGPCPTTNALKIMQAEGLPVAEVSSGQ